MGLETVVNIADLVRTNPPGSDPKSQGDDHLRNIKTALLNNIVGYTGAVTVTGVDGGAVNAYTLTPAAGTLLAYGLRMVAIFSPTITNTGAATLNISGLGAKNVLSVAGIALVANDLIAGRIYVAVYNGTEFRLAAVTQNFIEQLAFGSALPAQPGNGGKFPTTDGGTPGVVSWTDTFTIPITFNSRLNEAKGADIASAPTINLTTATGNLIHITGTTTITAITIPVGAERTVIFDGALTLTHGAGLLLPGAANILTAPGARAIVRGDTSGANVIDYTPANGAPIAPYPYLKVSDQKASGTGGGTSVASDITQTRTLNTTEVNTISGASLATNTITLPAGTYLFMARVPAQLTSASHKAFLYNSSDATYTGIGSSMVGAGSSNDSVISGQFSISAQKNYTIRHWTGTATAGGLGGAASTGQVEVYTEVQIWKVA